MNDIIIKEVSSYTDKMNFIKFPWIIYRNDKNWVPPLIFDVKNNLDIEKNPFFKHAKIKLFLAYKNDKIAGRISSIINHNHNNKFKDRTGFWGHFECINDQEIADTLFKSAAKHLSSEGMDLMRGPINLSTNDEVGLLVNSFDKPPVIMMTYNPEYYVSLIENFGFKKVKDIFAYLMTEELVKTNKASMAKLERISNLVLKRENLVVRKLRMSEIENELMKVKEIYNKAWVDNWGFVPMTEDEFKYIVKIFKPIVDPDLVYFAEHNGKPVGFSLSIPDMNQVIKKLNGRLFPFGIFKFLANRKKINRIRIIIMGVINEFQRKGIDAVFIRDTITEGMKKKYNEAEISWVLEDNIPMVQTAINLGAKQYKTYRIYDYKIF